MFQIFCIFLTNQYLMHNEKWQLFFFTQTFKNKPWYFCFMLSSRQNLMPARGSSAPLSSLTTQDILAASPEVISLWCFIASVCLISPTFPGSFLVASHTVYFFPDLGLTCIYIILLRCYLLLLIIPPFTLTCCLTSCSFSPLFLFMQHIFIVLAQRRAKPG